MDCENRLGAVAGANEIDSKLKEETMSSQSLEATTASEVQKATLGPQKVETPKATASKVRDNVFIDWLFIGLTLVGGLVVLLASLR